MTESGLCVIYTIALVQTEAAVNIGSQGGQLSLRSAAHFSLSRLLPDAFGLGSPDSAMWLTDWGEYFSQMAIRNNYEEFRGDTLH